ADDYNLNLRKDNLFSHGWHRLEQDADDGRARWIEKRLGVVEIIRTRISDLRVQLRVSPPEQNDALEPQRIRILWNGHSIDNFKLDWGPQKIAFKVPRKFQRIGQNRLEILPSYWVSEDMQNDHSETRSISLKLRGASFRDQTAPTAPKSSPARAENGGIRQMANTALSYSLFLPEGATLSGSGSLLGPPRPEKSASVAVRLATAAGQEEILEEYEFSSNSSFQFTEDLSQLGGKAVTLTFSYSDPTTFPEDASALHWDDLRVEGVEDEDRQADFEVKRRHFNILLVLFDTLRADHTEPYGSTTVKTPTLSRLASEGVTFQNSTSSSSWTRTSVASLFTSTYPAAHKTLEMDDKLPEAIPYLPELLSDVGYSTTFMTTNPTTGSSMGFSRGSENFFEFWDERRRFLKKIPSAEELAKHVWKKMVRPVLPANNSRHPFFIYLHEPDPHGPYTPVEPYKSLYEFGYRGNLSSRVETLKLFNHGHSDLDPTDIRFLESMYDGEISFSDAYLGELLEQLQANALRENTLVIVVSDHGEEFLDHGRLGHGVSLYEEQLHVPIMFSLPGTLPENADIFYPAELIDIPPTILDLIGEEIPENMAGQSLVPMMFRDRPASTQRPRHAKLRNSHDSVHLGPWKLIREFRNQSGRRFNTHSLYNLESDPEEEIDLWAQERTIGSALRQQLDWQLLQSGQIVFDRERIPESELSPNEIEELKALGYL
ncbi:sulfatase, partial [Myxococcota bacterium]|nr:sulfatase [Myxococcota bacterium]